MFMSIPVSGPKQPVDRIERPQNQLVFKEERKEKKKPKTTLSQKPRHKPMPKHPLHHPAAPRLLVEVLHDYALLRRDARFVPA